MLGDAGSIPSTSSKSAVEATLKDAKPPPNSNSAKNKPRAGAKASCRGARAKETRPEQAKPPRTSTPPPKPTASPLASNPRKDLSLDFAKAADDAAPAVLASPPIKSPYHKKPRITEDPMETCPSLD